MKKNIEILDEKEAEFRRLIPFASKIFGHQKQFTRDGLKKWKARRRTFTAKEIACAFHNLTKECDQWKINNNGFRPLTWWLHSDQRIEDCIHCHLKRGKAPSIAIIS